MGRQERQVTRFVISTKGEIFLRSLAFALGMTASARHFAASLREIFRCAGSLW